MQARGALLSVAPLPVAFVCASRVFVVLCGCAGTNEKPADGGHEVEGGENVERHAPVAQAIDDVGEDDGA